MNLKDFLEDCKDEKVIDAATVDRIYEHFLVRQKQNHTYISAQPSQPKNNNGLIITVGIIGVLLVGFGIIYLFAHNWDQLSRSTKTTLSFLPVIISILANVFTLTKRKDNIVWQESTAVSTFLAVGSMLALILQIYHLPGIENYFFIYWCALCIPVVYLLNSHIAVFCAMILILLNLLGNPMDQSSIFRLPWFSSLLLFTTLIPYFKNLFTLRKPERYYVLQQMALPLVVCLSVIASMQAAHASIWLITFLLLGNFHLFGTSVFLRNEDRRPTLMSILSYIGVSLSLSYILVDPEWKFERLFDVETNDYRLIFIPILLIIGIVQVLLFYKKEKLSTSNAFKLLIFFPLPFIALDYLGYEVSSMFQILMIITCFLFIHFAQKNSDGFQLYPALSLITVLILSFIFQSNIRYSLFFFALVPSLYYFATSYFVIEQSKNKLNSDQIIILCLQLLILIVASFEGFWSITRFDMNSLKSYQLVSIVLICIGIVVFAYKSRKQIVLHFSGVFGIASFLVPLLIFVGCVSNFGMQHFFTVLLLLFGISMLVFGARKANLTVANLSLALIGIVLLCRFFDLKMSLTVKGILFIAIGTGFFLANYLIFKNKKHENS